MKRDPCMFNTELSFLFLDIVEKDCFKTASSANWLLKYKVGIVL